MHEPEPEAGAEQVVWLLRKSLARRAAEALAARPVVARQIARASTRRESGACIHAGATAY